MDLKHLSSNWKRLQASGILQKSSNPNPPVPLRDKSRPQGKTQHVNLKRKRSEGSTAARPVQGSESVKQFRKMPDNQVTTEQFAVQDGAQTSQITSTNEQRAGDHINEGLAKHVDIGKYLALDCEMVGVGPHPHLESALARVSIVNYNGDQVYDSYVKPQEEVTDWRTHVSGIQAKHMIHARTFEEVQAQIASLLKGRIVVGHSLRGDFDALFLDHPKRDIRDTARHPPFRKLAGGVSPKLKILASELLGLDIQGGEHSSIEDARATMLLFRKDKDGFEREHIKKWGAPFTPRNSGGDGTNDPGMNGDGKSGKASKKPKQKKKKR